MNLQRCGTVLILFLALICISSTAEASKKKKRVIVKVPSRIKHIYHHHTKNLHIHKPKTKPVSYDSPPKSRPPIPYSGGKKRSPPWREEKNSYDDDYGYDEYDYGNYGYGGWGEDKGRYKDDRGRWKDDKRGGYDYDTPKRGRWREESKRVKGYSGYSKRSPQYKPSRRNAPKKPYRDMYEGAGTAPWPEVKEHDSWHQLRPQGFQQNSRILPLDQYHDTSIHAVDYTDNQPSNFHPTVVSLDRPNYDRAQSFDRPQSFERAQSFERPQSFDRAQSFDRPSHLEPHSTNIRPTFDRPLAEPLHHPPPSDYQQPQASNHYPVSAEGAEYPHPTGPYPLQSNFDQTESFHDPEVFQPHHLQ